jgi:long-chain acyl-CoA synthetase
MLKTDNNKIDNTAIIYDGCKHISYNQIYEIGRKITNGLERRSLVFCLSGNNISSLVGYNSFINAKIVPLMLDENIDQLLLRELFLNYKPKYLWLSEEKSFEFQSFKIIKKILGYVLLEDCESKAIKINDNLGLLLTTSGSTGSPKLVRLSYNNIITNAESIAEYLSIDEKERPITSLPMYYSFGLSIINSHLIKGATILLTNNSFMEREFWSFLKTHNATSFSGIPYSFEMLKKLRFFNMDIPSLTTITQAGGKLNDELNREFAEYCKKAGKRFFVMYGQTEATARMSYLPHEYSLKKLGSMGIAIPGGKFSLIDETGNIIDGPEEEGELVYKGSNVSMGYAKCSEDLERGNENKGILKTGDLAKRDEDGYYYIVGRKKRFIKLYGNRVNLDETERLIKNIIPDCACSGQDDKMIIYLTESKRAEDVKHYISHKMGINFQAFDIKCITEIPKNSSGKTIYSKLPL